MLKARSISCFLFLIFPPFLKQKKNYFDPAFATENLSLEKRNVAQTDLTAVLEAFFVVFFLPGMTLK